MLALALTGTALAFALFAWAQARVPAAVAGAFVNLEPLVGALTGAVVFHDVVGPAQLAGGAAILVGIMLGLPRDRATVAEAPGPSARSPGASPSRPIVHFGRRAPLTAARLPKCTARPTTS